MKPANPLRDKRFRWFFAARVVSLAGNAMSPVALAFAVLQSTHSAGWLSVVLAAQFTPAIGLRILGGGFADRYPRDVLLRISHVAAGLAQAGVAAAVITHAQPGLLIPLSFLTGASSAFINPALHGIVPQLVPAGGVQRANSLLGTSHNAVRILGPTIAGLLVAGVGGGWAIALDAASFLIAAGCLVAVRVPAHTAARTGLISELRAGWSYFRSLPWVWATTIAFTVINAIQQGVWQVLGPVIALETIGAPGWGLVLSARAIGLLVFSAVMMRWTLPGRPLLIALPAVGLGGAPLVLLGLHAPLAALAGATFVAGMGSALFGITWDTTLQTTIPNDLISRVTSYDDVGSYAAIPIGQLAVVPLAALVGLTAVAVGGGIGYALAGLAPLTLRSVRSVGTHHPTS
jgi:MFS family permease